MIRFEWGETKSVSNQARHGVSFEEAQTVFFDDEALFFSDPDHSNDEDRFLLLERSFRLRVVIVCHCYREQESVIRIISARRATRKERLVYTQRGKP